MIVKLIAALVICFLVLPVLIIIPMSFSSSQYLEFPPPGFSTQWYEAFFNNISWTTALKNSIELGLLTTVFALILGVMASIGLQKAKFRFKGVITEFFMMPMLIPAIIIGLAIYRFESQWHLSGTMTGLVIAHTILAVPFVIKTVLASLAGLDPNLELAARISGANPFKAFIKVVFPCIRPALFSAAMFAFATSFDEIVVTQFIAGIRVNTLPKKMWEGLKQQLDPTITAIAAILIVGITLLMVAMNARDIFYRKPKAIKEEVTDDE